MRPAFAVAAREAIEIIVKSFMLICTFAMVVGERGVLRLQMRVS